MSNSNIFRFGCICVLWIFLCYLVVKGRGIDTMSIFTIVASGIIVFVPLYKKYIRKKK